MLRSILTPAACCLLSALTLSVAPGCDPGRDLGPDDDNTELPGPDDDVDGGETIGDDDSEPGFDPTPDPMPEPDDGNGEPAPPKPSKPEAASPCAEEQERSCTTEDGEDGTSYCVNYDGQDLWTACEETPSCWPGDGYDYGCMGGYCAFDGESLSWYEWSEPDCNTPLVVNFERAPLSFEPASGAEFNINGAAGECVNTDWPTLPWLALDRDHSGTIDSGKELFGSGTVLASGARASQGFEALAELDHNHDGVVDAQDPAFADLVLWSDHNGDRRGDLFEQTPVSSTELVAIHLDTYSKGECDNRGNCGGQTSTFEFRSPTGERRQGEIIDVYLPCR